ncbi:transcription factor Tfb2 [Auriculariales sp. MPI-PUGE-AT-0066]|nr:transcription factor Tfb2 [Auriculariales sp. MPI-PUGE-AT-0066]
MARAPPKVDLHAHALMPFLQQQNQSSLSRLYQKPSVCLAVYRLVSDVERQIIMSLLWLEDPVQARSFNQWVTKAGGPIYQESIFQLCRLQIIPTPSTMTAGSAIPNLLSLNATFKANLRLAFLGGGSHRTFGVAAPSHLEEPTTVAQLDGYAVSRWETILHFMVSSGTDTRAPVPPSQDVVNLLVDSGLMKLVFSIYSEGGRSGHRITSEGFGFLLATPHDQLWKLLLAYLGNAEKRGLDLVDVLALLLLLSTMELGVEYVASNLSPDQLHMLRDMSDFGIVYLRGGSGTQSRFCPTRLATTLASSLPELPHSSGSLETTGGFVILETNYRLYAYTDNPLQIAVLNLFVSFKSRFPNLVVGHLTRDSVKKALNNGITAGQIIAYLTAHAHPQMRKNNPLLPVTVQDQIRLWELERNRLQSDEGYLYTEFTSQADYDLVLDYARKLGMVVWSDPKGRRFFARTEAHQSIKAYVDRRKVDMSSMG